MEPRDQDPGTARIDALARAIGSGRSRRAVLAAAAMALVGGLAKHGLAAERAGRADQVDDKGDDDKGDDASADRRRRRRPKPTPTPIPPPPTCLPAQAPCSSPYQCCEGRSCASNGISPQVCCGQSGMRCSAHYDCCGALLCNFTYGICA